MNVTSIDARAGESVRRKSRGFFSSRWRTMKLQQVERVGLQILQTALDERREVLAVVETKPGENPPASLRP
jgi:hypothetical protein